MTAVVNAVGWALLHFVWQGALVAAIFAVAVRLLRTPEARYALGVGAMFAMLALPVVTATRYASGADTATGRSANAATRAEPPVTAPMPDAPTGPIESLPAEGIRGSLASPESRAVPAASAPWNRLRPILAPLADSLPSLVALWLAGVFILSLRLFDAWLHARRLTRQGTRPAPEAQRLMLERLAERLRIWRRVSIVESTLLRVPAVVGWLRPVVLLPAVALTGLTAQQVEALIAHELAHVKRHDFLANIIQSAIETLLFYHPAVWYVSRRVREEREHCCDDIAVGICGSPDEYARALLRVAEGSVRTPALVAAATGGPLLARVRRLLAPGVRPAETFPRWIVGSTVLLAAALLASAGRVLEANEARPPMVRAGEEGAAVGADTVLHAPPGPLAARWQWARDEARRRGYRAFWVGYTIEPLATKENRSIYVGRMERYGLEGPGVSLRGRIVSFGDFEGFRVPGVKLAPIVGGGMPDDVAILFLYTAGRDGRATLARVHASSMVFPVDLEGRAVMWLGEANDGESVPLVRRLYDEAPNADLREDVVAMVGLHSTSSVVVPVLLEWVEGRGPDGTRAQAVEWLARHPTPAALNALAGAARRDRSAEVRSEAAESVGEMEGPAGATDTLIALARTLEDTDARREAVEGLGERGDDRAVDALAKIVREERNPDLQREGAESLGESGNPRSIPLLIEIARTHPMSDVQREAIESLGETKDAGALSAVEELAASHPNLDARREAIETMGEGSPEAATVAKLAQMAREESNPDVVREAIETIAETHHADAPRIIAEIARTHRSAEVRREATEELAEVGDRGEAVKLLEEIATKDADPGVRREAIETLGEAATAERFVALARELLETNPPQEVWHELLETLEELKGGEGIPVLVSTARSHGNPEIRQRAFQVLAESEDPRARKLFEDALSR